MTPPTTVAELQAALLEACDVLASAWAIITTECDSDEDDDATERERITRLRALARAPVSTYTGDHHEALTFSIASLRALAERMTPEAYADGLVRLLAAPPRTAEPDVVERTAEAIAAWLVADGLFPNDDGMDVYKRAYNNGRRDAADDIRKGKWKP